MVNYKQVNNKDIFIPHASHCRENKKVCQLVIKYNSWYYNFVTLNRKILDQMPRKWYVYNLHNMRQEKLTIYDKRKELVSKVKNIVP